MELYIKSSVGKSCMLSNNGKREYFACFESLGWDIPLKWFSLLAHLQKNAGKPSHFALSRCRAWGWRRCPGLPRGRRPRSGGGMLLLLLLLLLLLSVGAGPPRPPVFWHWHCRTEHRWKVSQFAWIKRTTAANYRLLCHVKRNVAVVILFFL